MTKSAVTPRQVACALLLAAAPAIGHAGQEPLWEVGAGVAWIDFPKYRGSNERRAYVLPLPYVTYNGENLQVRRSSATGRIFHSDAVELDISVNGSIPSGKDTVARSGMPNLDATFEVGPQLKVHLYHDDKKESILDLRLPLRPAFATDLTHIQDVGWIFLPQLDWGRRNFRHTGWNTGLAAGPVYADKRYNRYFYAVDPQYATPARPAYTAHGGYSGFQVTASVSKRFPGYWTGGFVKWDNLNGAVFADSPLITSTHHFTFGWAIAWVLDKSERMVEVTDD